MIATPHRRPSSFERNAGNQRGNNPAVRQAEVGFEVVHHTSGFQFGDETVALLRAHPEINVLNRASQDLGAGSSECGLERMVDHREGMVAESSDNRDVTQIFEHDTGGRGRELSAPFGFRTLGDLDAQAPVPLAQNQDLRFEFAPIAGDHHHDHLREHHRDRDTQP